MNKTWIQVFGTGLGRALIKEKAMTTKHLILCIVLFLALAAIGWGPRGALSPSLLPSPGVGGSVHSPSILLENLSHVLLENGSYLLKE
jgi:hypothetical protein